VVAVDVFCFFGGSGLSQLPSPEDQGSSKSGGGGVDIPVGLSHPPDPGKLTPITQRNELLQTFQSNPFRVKPGLSLEIL